MILRVVPYSGVSYYSFDVFETALKSISDNGSTAQLTGMSRPSDVQTRFLAGAGAGATATMVTYPLDLLRARMAAHWSTVPRYGSYTSAVRTIVQNEGLFA